MSYTGYKIITQRDVNPYSPTHNDPRKVREYDDVMCPVGGGINREPVWKITSQECLKDADGYNTGIYRTTYIDTNVNSDTHGDTKYEDVQDLVLCEVVNREPAWVVYSETCQLRPETGYNNGYKETINQDSNVNSPTYGDLSDTIITYDTTACPLYTEQIWQETERYCLTTQVKNYETGEYEVFTNGKQRIWYENINPDYSGSITTKSENVENLEECPNLVPSTESVLETVDEQCLYSNYTLDGWFVEFIKTYTLYKSSTNWWYAGELCLDGQTTGQNFSSTNTKILWSDGVITPASNTPYILDNGDNAAVILRKWEGKPSFGSMKGVLLTNNPNTHFSNGSIFNGGSLSTRLTECDFIERSYSGEKYITTRETNKYKNNYNETVSQVIVDETRCPKNTEPYYVLKTSECELNSDGYNTGNKIEVYTDKNRYSATHNQDTDPIITYDENSCSLTVLRYTPLYDENRLTTGYVEVEYGNGTTRTIQNECAAPSGVYVPTDNEILYATFYKNNKYLLLAEFSGGGTITVEWSDGVIETFTERDNLFRNDLSDGTHWVKVSCTDPSTFKFIEFPNKSYDLNHTNAHYSIIKELYYFNTHCISFFNPYGLNYLTIDYMDVKDTTTTWEKISQSPDTVVKRVIVNPISTDCF